ncbi:MAG: CpaF family protein [Clostridiales bacterium]|nr:CpaF family protein [Clostridiales bacterium]
MKSAIEFIKQKVARDMEEYSEIRDEDVIRSIEKSTFLYCEKEGINLNGIENIVRKIQNDMLGFGVLQPLFDNDRISEIMINDGKVFYEENGKIFNSKIKIDGKDELMKIIGTICRKSGRTVNAASPITDACLDDGTRINIVLNPISVDGHSVTIRKFPEKPITRHELVRNGFISEKAMTFLENTFIARYNLFICGGAGTGKTTLLNVLANCVGSHERIITIEDSAELCISSVKNIVRLEARTGNSEGGEITIRDLIRTSLRMRPDRIIVGEVRGKEALDMLQAMNTGHEGSISTGHANSCAELISRIETMVLMGSDMPLNAVRSQIISAIDIVVCLSRNGHERYVSQICEILPGTNGNAELNVIFDYNHERHRLFKKGELVNSSKTARFANG